MIHPINLCTTIQLWYYTSYDIMSIHKGDQGTEGDLLDVIMIDPINLKASALPSSSAITQVITFYVYS